MLRERLIAAWALATLSLLVLTTVPVHSAAAPASTVLLQEDAEEATYAEWDARWQRFDLNKDVVDGSVNEDFWCRSAHNLRDSAHAIYASRNGYNSHYLVPVTQADGSIGRTQAWNVNVTGLPGTTPQSQWVPRYDTGQDSIMKKTVVGASAFSTVNLSFWFWSDAGASDAKQPLTGQPVGHDFLNVLYWTDGGDPETKRVLWTNSAAQAAARTWIYVNLEVPNDVGAIGFEFVSGTVAPEGGDADDAFAAQGVRVINGGMREGVYLDDIVLTGSDASGSVPVTTSVDGLAPVQGARTFGVGFTVNQPTVPFDHVNLYYRQGSDGDWTMYGGNHYSSPISFTATSDGRYEFFTQGFDVNGENETMRPAPEAYTVVDTAGPVTAISVSGTSAGENTYSGPASFALSASDEGSGVASTYYRVDSSSWIRYGGEVTISNGGSHLVQYYSTDLAGNVESARTMTIAIETSDPIITFPEPGKAYPSGTVTVQFQVASASSIAELRASLDGEANSSVDPALRSVTFTGLGAGEHRVTIWARDADGRWGQNMTSFTVASGGRPDVPVGGMTLMLGSLSPSYSVGDTVRLTWTCSVAGAGVDHFAVLVDDRVIATLDGSAGGYDITGLAEGSHKIAVLAVMADGLSAERSAILTVKAKASAGGAGSAQDMIIVGGVAVFGVLAAVLIIFMRSRRMY